MAIVILTFVGIALLMGVTFWCWNAWSSRAEDRKETATIRSGRQQTAPNTMKRGVGIN
jgi:hypothetical protein